MGEPGRYADRHGNGSFRRRIRLTSGPGAVVRAALEDEMHHYRVVLHHDRVAVTAIEGEAVRVPWTTCPDAGAHLDRLVGLALTRRPQDAVAHTDPRLQCTHWFDLAVLAVIHAAAGRDTRQFDVEVPDWTRPPFDATLAVDGEEQLRWTVGDGFVVISSGRYEGVGLRGGFSKWAEATLDDDEVERAFVLHRGTWLSPARRFDLEGAENAEVGMVLPGACHTGQPERIGVALRSRGSLRDYGPSADRLLSRPGDPPPG